MFTEEAEAEAYEYSVFFSPDDDLLSGPDPDDFRGEDLPERDDDNACDECDEGAMVAGMQEYDTGHVPWHCTHCGHTE